MQLWIAAKRLTEASKLLKEKKIAEAVTAFNDVEHLQTGLVTATQWNDLYWEESLTNHATQVLPACDQAIAKAKNDTELWIYYDNRGLARSLSGNLPSAIKDFEFAIEKNDNEIYRQQRRDWIQALRLGKNPFSHEVLESFRNQ